MPVEITRQAKNIDNKQRINVQITALDDVFFNYGEQLRTGYRHEDCLFYMPGFWYRRNLRSPKEAPSFHTSDSWLVREDRLSTPLTAVFNEKEKISMAVIRLDKFDKEALTTHKEGEVILSGKRLLVILDLRMYPVKRYFLLGFLIRKCPKHIFVN